MDDLDEVFGSMTELEALVFLEKLRHDATNAVASKPWLLSDANDLLRDAVNNLKYKTRWQAGFPGASSSLIAKQVWAAGVLQQPDDDVEVMFERGRPQDPGEVLKDILYDSCPPALTLELLVPRDRIAAFQPTDTAKFMAAAERRAAPNARANGGFQAWKAWLQHADPGSAVDAEAAELAEAKRSEAAATAKGKGKGKAKAGGTSEAASDLVLVGSLEVSRDDCTREAVLGLVQRLGMDNAELRAWCSGTARMCKHKHASMPGGPLIGWRGDGFDAVRDKCGEMAHFPSAVAAPAAAAAAGKRGKKSKKGKAREAPAASSFAMLVVSCTTDEGEGGGDAGAGASSGARSTQAQATAEVESNAFRRELADLKEKAGRSYLLRSLRTTEEEDGEDEDEKEPQPMTSKNTAVIWLPPCWDEVRDRVQAHGLHGEGEAWAVRDSLEAGTTRTGNTKIDLFRCELEAAKKIKGGQRGTEDLPMLRRKFCTLLAITRTMQFDNYWTNDNECPEELEALLEDLAKALRAVLKRSDDELGLGVNGVAGGAQAATHGPGASRTALYVALDAWKERLLVSEYTESRFNYKPPKAKRARDPLAPQPVNQAEAKRQKAATAASSGEAGDGDGRALAALAAWLKADVPKFSTKTALQLRCERVAGGGDGDGDGDGDVRVLLVSPKTSFWKLSQFVAFAYGLSPSAEYHSQKGSVLKGATCTVRRPIEPSATGDVDVLICSKRAAGKRAFIVDKNVPAAAAFRCDPDSVTKRTWAGKGKAVVQSESDAATEVTFRFEGDDDSHAVRITLEAVGDVGGKQMLPVAVTSSACSLSNAELDGLNQKWLGDRQGPSLIFFGDNSAASVNAAVWRVQRMPVLEL